VAIGSFLVNYFMQPDIGGFTAQAAAKYVSFYWGGAMVGRFAGSAVLRKVPTGPAVAVAAIAAFLQFGTLGMALYVSGVSIVITSVEGWLLTPWLSSRAARTNEVAMFIGLIFWSFVWGIWGTLLAVPMLVVVKAFCDRIEDLKPIGELLGE
jgi:predicted PurR-regulated permease PerM